jgi:hypothetical protein
MEYIQECGVGTWREERMRSGSKVARLFPANSCGKQLVFFSTYAGERDDPDRVATIWILNASETWSETMDPVYPDMGARIDKLKGRYPPVKNNAVVMEYIRECGVGRWDEKNMDSGFLAVHIPPGNSCGKQLVFSTKMAGGYGDPTQIEAAWILDANETWSGTMDPVYPDWWTYRVQGLLAGTSKNPPFFVVGVVITLALIGIAFALIGRRK